MGDGQSRRPGVKVVERADRLLVLPKRQHGRSARATVSYTDRNEGTGRLQTYPTSQLSH